jgi:hypothetical protein
MAFLYSQDLWHLIYRFALMGEIGDFEGVKRLEV